MQFYCKTVSFIPDVFLETFINSSILGKWQIREQSWKIIIPKDWCKTWKTVLLEFYCKTVSFISDLFHETFINSSIHLQNHITSTYTFRGNRENPQVTYFPGFFNLFDKVLYYKRINIFLINRKMKFNMVRKNSKIFRCRKFEEYSIFLLFSHFPVSNLFGVHVWQKNMLTFRTTKDFLRKILAVQYRMIKNENLKLEWPYWLGDKILQELFPM